MWIELWWQLGRLILMVNLQDACHEESHTRGLIQLISLFTFRLKSYSFMVCLANLFSLGRL